MLFEIGQRHQHAGAVGLFLAHADNAAGADIDARLAHALQRVQPVLKGPGADDLVVIFFRRIDIVIVVVETGLGETVDLLTRQHAERHAGFHAHFLHALHDGADRVHVAILGLAPGGAHAIARRPGFLRLAGLCEHLFDFHQLGGLEAGVEFRALGAIAAILGTAAGLDREQRRHLHLVRVEPAAMGDLRLEDEIVEGQGEKRLDFLARPVMTQRPRVGPGGGRGRVSGFGFGVEFALKAHGRAIFPE